MSAEVVIVGADGNEHVFPAGFDPKKAAAIVRQRAPAQPTIPATMQSPATANRGVTPDAMGNAEWGALPPTEKLRNALQWGGKAVSSMTGMGAAGDDAVANPTRTLATAAIVPAFSAAKNAIPSAARAGAKFQEVMGAAKNVPIDISAPGDTALRIMQLSERGGTMPKVVRDILKRMTDPNKPPMAYEEARDFASNISRLSANEYSRLPPAMMREVHNLRVTLNHAVEKAAGSAGKGPQYKAAMKEYAKAARGREMIDDVKTAAKRWAIPGGAAYFGLNKLSDLLRGD